MNNLLSLLLVIPILLWCVFTPVLYTNAMLIEQALSNVVYETQKEASLQGRYDEDLYKKMKDRLVNVYKFDPNKIEIKGTETLTKRGGMMTIEVIIPKPQTSVIKALSPSSKDNSYRYKKHIMSEYTN